VVNVRRREGELEGKVDGGKDLDFDMVAVVEWEEERVRERKVERRGDIMCLIEACVDAVVGESCG
jgi:hypothetical protein